MSRRSVEFLREDRGEKLLDVVDKNRLYLGAQHRRSADRSNKIHGNTVYADKWTRLNPRASNVFKQHLLFLFFKLTTAVKKSKAVIIKEGIWRPWLAWINNSSINLFLICKTSIFFSSSNGKMTDLLIVK